MCGGGAAGNEHTREKGVTLTLCYLMKEEDLLCCVCVRVGYIQEWEGGMCVYRRESERGFFSVVPPLSLTPAVCFSSSSETPAGKKSDQTL